MNDTWSDEFWRVIGFGLAALLLGLLLGHVAGTLLLATLGYLGWHLRNVYRLERWLREGKSVYPPEGGGIWADIFYRLHKLLQHYRARKRRLGGYIAQFQELTAAMPDATVVLGLTHEIEWFNDAAGGLLGLRPQDRGQRIDNLIRHPQFVTFLHEPRTKESVDFPSPVDARVMLAARIVPYGEERRLLVVRDVTRVHRLEQMRRDFIANVSHELRTPLTVIRGYVETMSDAEDEFSQRWDRPLKQMAEQTARMQHIVEELLLLSRLETEGRPQEAGVVAVPALLQSVRDEAAALSGGQHAIDLSADPALFLKGSESEMRSAFSNLLSNAVRYTPAGGRIRMRWYADDRGAHFAVEDTGIGVALQHIPRLTERFYRVDAARSRETGGTGLGLAIVKHVLERHDARLQIDSAPGVGSTFICDFPSSLVVRKPASRTAS